VRLTLYHRHQASKLTLQTVNCLPTSCWRLGLPESNQRPFSGPPNGPFQGPTTVLFGAELDVHTDQGGRSSALHIHMYHTHQGSGSSALAVNTDQQCSSSALHVHTDQEGGSSAPKSSTDLPSTALSPASKPRAAGSGGRLRPSLVVVVDVSSCK
jgi:hypothetical protein